MERSSRFIRRTPAWLMCLLLLAGCGDDGDYGYYNGYSPPPAGGSNGQNASEGDWAEDNYAENQANEGGDEDFIPEEEEFLVQQVAATDSYVFVPNQSEDSDTVALIDGLDFSVYPIQVGRQPTQVVAADIEGQGSVGYVLSTGAATVAIIRADQGQGDHRADVRLLPVPREVNQLAMAPDGRHVLAYIDPNQPINASASAASLQTMALIRLGDEPGQDEVFQLSVTRLIDEIAFAEDSSLAFVVGRDGINRLPLPHIKDDAFIPTIHLGLSSTIFSPVDQEVAFSADGSLLALRTSQYAGVGIFELDPVEAIVANYRLVELEAVPTDLDLIERDGEPAMVMATLRSLEEVAIFSVDDALEADEEDTSFIRIVGAPGADVGIGRITPDDSAVIVFSTLPTHPVVGLLDLETETITTYSLRNQIRTLAISPDSRTAVVVHNRQEGTSSGSDWNERFRHSEGLTLWDLASGYRRPVMLDAEPEEILMTTNEAGDPFLFVMLTSSDPARQGVQRIDLTTHRIDFLRLPRPPMQLGMVAGQVFVSQEEETGRITFLDVETNQQRTVSGYELNAGIQ